VIQWQAVEALDSARGETGTEVEKASFYGETWPVELKQVSVSVFRDHVSDLYT
jgi:hypothetical protein